MGGWCAGATTAARTWSPRFRPAAGRPIRGRARGTAAEGGLTAGPRRPYADIGRPLDPGGTMRSTLRRPWIIGAVFAVAVLAAVPVQALIFGSSCDLFEVDGNEFGAADGVFDYVDEFDN